HHRVVANYAEHSTTGKSWRVTFTAPFINKAANVMFLVSGASKAQALKAVLKGPRDPKRLPAQLIQPDSGTIVWLVDQATASLLSRAPIATGAPTKYSFTSIEFHVLAQTKVSTKLPV